MKQFFGLMFFFIAACSNNPMQGTVKPTDLITKDQMVAVLIDLNLIEADLQMKYSHVSFYSDAMKKSGHHILKKHGFKPSQFEISFDYYASRQEEMMAINNQILDSMNLAAAKISQTKKLPENNLQVEESMLIKRLN